MAENKYDGHYYLRGRNAGTSTLMRGKVAYVVVFVDDPKSDWSNPEEVQHFKKIINDATKELTRQAAAYKTRLKLLPRYEHVKIDKPVNNSSGSKEYLDEIIKALAATSLTEYLNAAKKRMRCDSIAMLLAVNRDDRSFASISGSTDGNFDSSEISVIFTDLNDGDEENVRTICHETAHEFGAHDYYYPKITRDTAAAAFGEQLLMDYGLKIDSLTAYLIGWTDTLDAAAEKFLEATKTLTNEYMEEERKKNTITGFGKKDNGNYTATGFFDNGMLQGHGIEEYNSGLIQTSLWKTNRADTFKFTKDESYTWVGGCRGGERRGPTFLKRTDGTKSGIEYEDGKEKGIGLYEFSDGTVKAGVYAGTKLNGFGQIKYRNGAVYSGEFVNDQPEGYGVQAFPDGSMYFGYFKDGLRHGKGTFIDKKGKLKSGTWVKNHKKII